MRRLAMLGGLTALAGTVHGGLVDPALETVLEEADPGEMVSALVYLVDQVDTAALTDQLDAERVGFALRHEVVVSSLQDLALNTQADLVAHLGAAVAKGTVQQFRPFWLRNVIRVDAIPSAIEAIADRPDVEWVYLNYELELVAPVTPPGLGGPGVDGTIEAGVEAVRAPEVWDMGITGEGVLVATLDTGVDGNHPALANRWRGVADPRYSDNPEWAWFDPVTNTTFPTAFGSHGTHTMGTVCGGAPGEQVGVAPGAQWIHAATIDRVSIPQTVSDSILAFEWMVDPDGDPATSWDVPAVCANSWGLVTSHGYPPCDETFWSYLDACEAAGTMIVFAAGNEGTSGLRRPGDRATDDYRTHAVAAVDGNNPSWPIASFSSRGPTTCTPDGSQAIKPDISAPGVNVRSSVPGGGYGDSSGTSMATPHVGGVVALIRQANPDISVQQMKQIIYDTAFDLGTSGEDNSYGWGMIDAFEAVTAALSTVNLTFSFPDGRPELLDPNGGTTITLMITGQATEPEAGTGRLYYSTGGDYTETPLEELGGDEYLATFPAFECGAHVVYYFSVETTEGDFVVNPFGAPDNNYGADVYTGLAVAFHDDFETDTGWSVEDSSGLTFGTWERDVPDDCNRGNPSRDADQSGQCYVTESNPPGGDCNFDVDDGTTTLTSPAMDGANPDDAISYSRWYSNATGGDPENDLFVVEVSDDDGASWVNLETVGPAGPEVNGGWFHKSFVIADIPGITNTDAFRIRFSASDLNEGSVVEAAVDGVMISSLYCEGGLEGDVNGDGVVDFEDLLMILAAWGPCEGCPEDANDDGVVDFADILLVLANWS